jgi:hypothetical protein
MPAPVVLARLRSAQPAEGDIAVRPDLQNFRRYNVGCRNVAAAGHNASAFGHNAAPMHNWTVADHDAAS